MKTTSKKRVVTLWIIRGLLGALLLWAAAIKFFMPVEKLAVMWPWTIGQRNLVLLTAAFDTLGGLGLILPGIIGRPKLTFYAAVGIIVLMITAIVFHISRGEASQIGINILVIFMSMFIALKYRGDKRSTIF